MELEVTREMLNRAKGTETVQELQAFAKAEGIELTEEAAKEVFAKLHPQSGELSDEELENVAGGGGYFMLNTETGAVYDSTGWGFKVKKTAHGYTAESPLSRQC